MFLELHILQNFAPSNLNRDDTGSPKDCEFGGYRRARISSQCLKRSIREAFRDRGLLPPERLACRTKRAVDALVKRLVQKGRPEAESQAVVEAALKGLGFGIADESKTQYLLYLGEAEMASITDLCDHHWDLLAIPAPAAQEGAAKSRAAKDDKKAAKSVFPPEVAKALLASLNGGKAADLALFGRMLADLPDRNVDAACQVAHAISTNKVSMEFDFYTAVDDLKPEDTAGADMLGTVEFNSSCFYRYSNIDLDQLYRNLHDEELARTTADAFVRASVAAVPTGKQNSMAAQNPPSLVLAVLRRSGLWSLANAFVQPVSPDRSGDLVQNSARKLDRYWGKLTAMYGSKEIAGGWVCTTDDGVTEQLAAFQVESVDSLAAGIREGIVFNGGPGGPGR